MTPQKGGVTTPKTRSQSAPGPKMGHPQRPIDARAPCGQTSQEGRFSPVREGISVRHWVFEVVTPLPRGPLGTAEGAVWAPPCGTPKTAKTRKPKLANLICTRIKFDIPARLNALVRF